MPQLVKKTPFSTKLKKWLKITIFLALTLLPLIFTIFSVASYGFNFPFWDQWELIPLLASSFEGNFKFSDLLAWHNEHRPFFPRLIMLLIAYPTRWNISYELITNLILSVLLFTTLLLQIKKTVQETKATKLFLLVPLISILVFSMSQWENFVWGWQIQIWLTVLSSTAGIFILTNHTRSYKRLFTSLTFGIVSLYSFSTGISYLLTGLIILITEARNKNGFFRPLIWLLASILLLLTYVYRLDNALVNVYFRGPVDLSSFTLEPLKFLLSFMLYLLVFFGSPLSVASQLLAIGIGTLCVLLIFSLPLILLKHFKYSIAAPYIFLNVFVIGTAIMIALARTNLGILQALASRYTTFSLLAWFSNITMLSLLLFKTKTFKNLENRQFFQKTILAGLVTIIVLVLVSSILGILELKKIYKILARYQRELVESQNLQTSSLPYHHIYPDKEILKERVILLRKYKLSIYK